MIPLDAISIQVSPYLAGNKKAVTLDGRTVAVSPAMYELMKHADADELKRLLESIEVVDMSPPRESAEEWVRRFTASMQSTFGLEGYLELCEQFTGEPKKYQD